MKVEGAVALVTGGAQGLGLAIAVRLAEAGAIVVVADRNTSALRSLPNKLQGVALDVTDADQVNEVVAQIANVHGHLDVLINNAGVILNEPFVNIMNPQSIMHDYGRFRESITANLDSVFIVTSAVVKNMVSLRTKGVIVNVSSISACGNEGQTAYSAAKAGVNAMTVTWAKELGMWGIRCNAIAPGFIATASTRQVLKESALKHIEMSTPLRRLGQAEEVAHAVMVLVENQFISGAVLDVNGGLRI